MKKIPKRNKFLLSLLSLAIISPLAFSSPSPQPQIIYVNANVSGGAQTGTSWGNAYNDLQQAINKAPDGAQIWIAAGTYVPSQIYAPDGVTGGAANNSSAN